MTVTVAEPAAIPVRLTVLPETPAVATATSEDSVL